MRQFIIVRHADALDTEGGFSHDFYRLLSKKGQKQAKKISIEFIKSGLHPDLIITSNAPRAYQTAMIIANNLGIYHENIVVHSECYGCSKEKRLEVIGYYEQCNIILICGHNPELLSLCQHYDASITILKKGSYYMFTK